MDLLLKHALPGEQATIAGKLKTLEETKKGLKPRAETKYYLNTSNLDGR